MKKIKIGISSIGSGVGQSVINSCNLSKLPLYTIGFGNNPFAFGLYECNDYAYTSSYYDLDYIENIIQNCLEHNVDIFIPGHDDEAHIVSKNIDKFKENNINVIVSDKELIGLCRNKEKMSLVLNEISPIFVKTYNKDRFLHAFACGKIELPVISKPIDGFASKGIHIIKEPQDFKLINDNDIIQELAKPHKDDPQYDQVNRLINNKINPQIAEISIQIVTDFHGNLIGKMASYNKLKNGVPIEIIPLESKLIWEEISKFLPTFKALGLRGPLNLQGRISDQGLQLFEMNARFTGITGLRATMGFNEVETCIKSWMGLPLQNEELSINYNNFGIRQTADKSISLNWNLDVKTYSSKINCKQLKTKKNILITGSTGFIGQNLIMKLVSEYSHQFEIWVYTRNKIKASSILPSGIKIYDFNDYTHGNLSLGNVDILLHLGFARPHKSKIEIANSLKFTHELFTMAVKNQVSQIINISSQSVYGQSNQPLWNENLEVAPDTVYAKAKFSSELILQSLVKFRPHLHFTSIRLAAVSGGQQGNIVQDLYSKLVRQVIEGKNIEIKGGQQRLEFIDVRDVVNALIALVLSDSKMWEPVYNLGTAEVISLKTIAETIVQRAQKKTGLDVVIQFTENDNPIRFGMDSSKIRRLIDWSPEYNYINIIDSLINYNV